jgi:hypothetical protein
MNKSSVDRVVIRTATRETYFLSRGFVSKVDLIRTRRQILLERAFMRPDGVAELKMEVQQYPTERDWEEARRTLLESLGLLEHPSGSTQLLNTPESARNGHPIGRRLFRMRNLWASLRAWLSSPQKEG